MSDDRMDFRLVYVENGEFDFDQIVPLDATELVVADGKIGLSYTLPVDGLRQMIKHLQAGVDKYDKSQAATQDAAGEGTG